MSASTTVDTPALAMASFSTAAVGGEFLKFVAITTPPAPSASVSKSMRRNRCAVTVPRLQLFQAQSKTSFETGLTSRLSDVMIRAMSTGTRNYKRFCSSSVQSDIYGGSTKSAKRNH
jgi:hypothetical protein